VGAWPESAWSQMSFPHALHDGQRTDRALRHAAAARLGLAMGLALLAGLGVTGALAPLVATLAGDGASGAPPSASHPYAAHQLVVSSSLSPDALVHYIRTHARLVVSTSERPSGVSDTRVLTLGTGQRVPAAAAAIAKLPAVRYAVPDYLATVADATGTVAATRAAGGPRSGPHDGLPPGTPAWVPDDPGDTGRPRGWEKLQWNFLPAEGVNAPEAWANLRADHRPGARGVVIAILDSGVAYRDWGNFKRSPDFEGTRFVEPCDLVTGTLRAGRCSDRFPLDRLGHGTFVAGTIAEATDNGIGLTGLAYRASIMPVRVLNASGSGTASTIAAGVRYAVHHGARVINLSVEFPPGTTASQIPELLAALRFAHDRGVVLVAAAGNDYGTTVDYPAAAPDVIAVGATTADGCLAAYSDIGRQVVLAAPGGGDDSPSLHTANCHPSRNLPDVYQMTFPNPASGGTAAEVDSFVMQSGWFGTSMATPDVSAAAAMVIASGVLGPRPSPDAILARLEATARHLAGAAPNPDYGYGLLDIGAATANGGPLTPTTTITTTTPTGPTITGTTTTTTIAAGARVSRP
ncbi:MAG: S8 family serine peptidase, partial [Solirubrobacteraceae bacterium]